MGTIIFLGDSITDANRLSSNNGLGFGYVNQIAATLKEKTAVPWNIINRGVDGFITERVLQNLPSDCIACKPNYVSILVGINNIGIIMNTARTEQQKTYILEDCIRAYHQLLFDLMQDTTAQVVTLEPFLFPYPQEYVNWIPWQQKLSKQIKKLARNYNASFIPLHDALNAEALKYGFDKITTDGIHLTPYGHELLAQIILNAWGL